MTTTSRSNELESLTASTVGSGSTKKTNTNSSSSLLTAIFDSSHSKQRSCCVLGVVCIAFLLIWNASGSLEEENNNGSGAAVVLPPIADSTTTTTTTTTDVVVQDNNNDVADTTPSTSTPSPTVQKKTDFRIPPLANPDPFHLPIDNATRDAITNSFGQWHFWDGDAALRPSTDFMQKYPNNDVPGSAFPNNAWQVDAVYVNHFLNDADLLLSRSMEAIFSEYGHGKPLSPKLMMERMHMFHVEEISSSEQNPPANFGRRGTRDTGGWTTQRSQQGLIRRLLHAMMTKDTFTVVLAGHSAAAGAGNHFRQSYIHQFHKIMFPVFARLGVKLVTRNISQGGLGTIQGSMGFAGIYGNNVDLVIWDSGMTENNNPEHVDLFLRQALLSGKRVPVVWGGLFPLLKKLHDECDADIGEHGRGTVGLVETCENPDEIPWAARYMKCCPDHADVCKEESRFNSVCWLDRKNDNVEPRATQLPHPKSQVKWHPGWRAHQLEGRVLAFLLLKALQSAVNTWSEATMSGQPLDDSYWHVTDYYENIRQKVQALQEGECLKIAPKLPKRMCHVPMNGRTQYTPRANFDESGITNLIKPASNGYLPKNEKVALYDGPDVHLPSNDVPEGQVDVLAIVMNRRRRRQLGSGDEDDKDDDDKDENEQKEDKEDGNGGDGKEEEKAQDDEEQNEENKKNDSPKAQQLRGSNSNGDENDAIVPGLGWQVFDEPQGTCDGEYLSVCGRSTDNPCILEGRHDARGAVIGNSLSGWLVLNIPKIQHGIVVIKLHTWHYESENTITEGWVGVNNSGKQEQQDKDVKKEEKNADKQDDKEDTASGDGKQDEKENKPEEAKSNEKDKDGVKQEQVERKQDDDDKKEDERRHLMRSYATPDLPDTFYFDYAIQGQITSLNKTEFLEQKQQIQRVVETLTLMDDENFPETENVEVAIRLRGCGRKCVFGLSHVYWS